VAQKSGYKILIKITIYIHSMSGVLLNAVYVTAVKPHSE